MTRFVFMADTHLGACPMEFQQQPGYPERLPELLTALRDWINENGHIDFILHAGDLLDGYGVERIREAVALFDLGVPLYVCLGNHDLTRPEAVAGWVEHAPQFFIGDSVQFEIVTDDCLVHVVPSHWCEETYYWRDVQASRLSADQIERVAAVAKQHAPLPQLLCTHSQVLGMYFEQTGKREPEHEPYPPFREQMAELLEQCPEIRCVLGGHNHANTMGPFQDALALSVSAFSSTPFEFRLIEVSREQIAITTHDLRDRVDFDSAYDDAKVYVLGRPQDRDTVWPLT